MKLRLVGGLKFMAISSHLQPLEVPPMKSLSLSLKDHLCYSSHSWKEGLCLKFSEHTPLLFSDLVEVVSKALSFNTTSSVKECSNCAECQKKSWKNVFFFSFLAFWVFNLCTWVFVCLLVLWAVKCNEPLGYRDSVKKKKSCKRIRLGYCSKFPGQ